MLKRVAYWSALSFFIAASGVVGFLDPTEPSRKLEDQSAAATDVLSSPRPTHVEKSPVPLTVSADSLAEPKTSSRDNPLPTVSTMTSTSPSSARSAAQGFYELGMMNFDGAGGERDLAAAFEFFSLASQLGDALAMSKLGWMYEQGLGIEANRKKALELYAQAAQLGDKLAQSNLQRLKDDASRVSASNLVISDDGANSPTGSIDAAPHAPSLEARAPVPTVRDPARIETDPSTTVRAPSQVHKRSRPDRIVFRSETIFKPRPGPLANSKNLKRKLSDRMRRVTPPKSAAAALRGGVIPPEGAFRQHCATGNWIGASSCDGRYRVRSAVAVWGSETPAGGGKNRGRANRGTTGGASPGSGTGTGGSTGGTGGGDTGGTGGTSGDSGGGTSGDSGGTSGDSGGTSGDSGAGAGGDAGGGAGGDSGGDAGGDSGGDAGG